VVVASHSLDHSHGVCACDCQERHTRNCFFITTSCLLPPVIVYGLVLRGAGVTQKLEAEALTGTFEIV
jgi:hypothetical protein